MMQWWVQEWSTERWEFSNVWWGTVLNVLESFDEIHDLRLHDEHCWAWKRRGRVRGRVKRRSVSVTERGQATQHNDSEQEA
jgi:hypothetical protein